jgi:hypothetical protein
MSILTRSVFYYGHYIDSSNKYLDFSEGAAEITAILTQGDYSLTEFVAELSRALNAAGDLTYTVSVNRATRIITIASTSNFTLKTASGTNTGSSVFGLAGFVGTDKTGAATYAGANASGSSFAPQFYLQKYIDFEDDQTPIDSTIRESSDALNVEVISFGIKKSMSCDIVYQNNYQLSNCPITYDAAGVLNLRTFMIYICKKRKIEFMKDKAATSTFSKCLLDSTSFDSKGLGFKLTEVEGVVGFYRSGILKFRLME